MTTMVHPTMLSQLLRLVPSRVLSALDAWSYRVALKRAERRRLAATARKTKAAAVIAQHQLPLTDFPA
jgi:hypothetical protein